MSDKDVENEEQQVQANEEASVEATEDLTAEEQLEAQIESLNDEVGQLKDQMLRVQAEAANIRRRSEIDVQNAHKFGQEKLVKDLLQVADNLERALTAIDREDEAVKPLAEGVELTLKSFIDNLAKHKVEAVNPVGEPFDPNLHQAMTMVPNADLEPNTVMDVMQKGYTLHGRIVRPAMVVVSKAAD
ncbi:nucleotide exchange factor GrpE [uncultured Umboniibacter sp.]|uniref:nucleotide exchange factor GrpE n=1 Tax=uncultured Umboniibacter sp. TaxID=1798917 RepID=UPI00262A92D8|nr:nucleotide exchange factor GrpE [uncultured Umboniibacter sp.]